MPTATITPTSKEIVTLKCRLTGEPYQRTKVRFGALELEVEGPDERGNAYVRDLYIGGIKVINGQFYSEGFTVTIDHDPKQWYSIRCDRVTIETGDVDWSYPDGHETSTECRLCDLL